MICEIFRAMGTTVDVFAADRQAVAATRELFAEIEATCSRFLTGSELSAVNRHAGTTVTVSPLLRNVLEAAAEACHLTEGLVDPAVGARVVDWGYDRSFELVDDIPSPPDDRQIGTWELSGDRLYLEPGVRIDLGFIAKGWACDQAIEREMATIVSAGGDVRSNHPDTQARVLGASGVTAALVRVGIGALATSSVTRRTWKAGDEPAHHLIDPRTGAPAVSPIIGASALATTAVAAEAGAKAALLHGGGGLAWLDRQAWLRGGMAVWQDGSVYATPSLELAA